MICLRRGLVFLAALSFGVAAAAQQPASAADTGTVTGHVTCGDTHLAARFGSVSLIRKMPPYDRKKVEDGSYVDLPKVTTSLTALTSSQGDYTIPRVPPGDYYLVGMMSGYIVPVRPPAKEAEAYDPDKALSEAPLLHVAADHIVRGDLIMQRGASVSGRVLYDDGTPTPNASVRLESIHTFASEVPLILLTLLASFDQDNSYRVTDDRGAYRVAGVRPDKYIVHATLKIGGVADMTGDGYDSSFGASTLQAIDIYAPGVFHRKEAKVIEIKGPQEFIDTDIQASLGKTHTVRGRVLALEDRHAPNVAHLQLTDPTDADFKRYAAAGPDGIFRFDFVPEGTYSIQVTATEDSPPADGMQPSQRATLRSYKPVEVPLIVDDHDLLLEDVMVVADKQPSDGKP